MSEQSFGTSKTVKQNWDNNFVQTCFLLMRFLASLAGTTYCYWWRDSQVKTPSQNPTFQQCMCMEMAMRTLHLPPATDIYKVKVGAYAGMPVATKLTSVTLALVPVMSRNLLPRVSVSYGLQVDLPHVLAYRQPKRDKWTAGWTVPVSESSLSGRSILPHSIFEHNCLTARGAEAQQTE